MLQQATDGGGITVSTGQLIAAIVALVGFLGSLLGVIRHLYEARLTDRDKTIAERDKRIEKLEAREEESRKASEKQMTLLEESVKTQKQQAEVVEAMYEKVAASAPARRSRTGDD